MCASTSFFTIAAGACRGDFVSGTLKPAHWSSGYAPAAGLVPATDIGITLPGESIDSLLAISTKLVGAGVPPSPVTNPGFIGACQPLDLMPNDGVGAGSVTTVSVGVCGPNHAPIAVLSAKAIGPRKNLKVQLEASRSSDPDATSSDPQLRDTVVKYVFDFGDGTPPLASTNPIVVHQYPKGGQYGTTLRVQDSRGKASEAEAVKQICEKCLKNP